MATTQKRRILLISLGSIALLLVGALILIPVVFEDRVADFIRAELNERLEATVDFVDIDLSLLSTFPTLTAEVEGLEITGQGAFDGEKLLGVRSLGAGLDLIALIWDERIIIESIAIDHPDIHVRVTTEGAANYDIVKETDDEESDESPLELQIRSLRIVNGSITYDTPDTHASLTGINQKGSIQIAAAAQALSSRTTVDTVSVRLGRVSYLENAKVGLNLDATLRPDDAEVTVDKVEIALNALSLGGAGSLSWTEEALDLDLEMASGKGQSIKALVSAIPSAYSQDLSGVTAGGRFSLQARVQGRLGPGDDDIPAFSISLEVRDGSLQYPDLPLPLSAISIDAKATHPGGMLDKVRLEVPQFALSAGGSHASGTAGVTQPISKPNVNLTLDARIDAADVANAYPMPDLETLSGKVIASLDLATSGEGIDRLAGEIQIAKLVYDEKDAPPVRIDEAKISLTPNSTRIQSFRAILGRSDISLSGTLSPITTFLDAESLISGNLRLESRAIHVDDFLSESSGGSEGAEGAAGETTPFLLPDGIDARLAIDVGKLTYGDLVLTRFAGSARLRNRTLTLDDVGAQALGGSMKVTGMIATPVGKPATFDMNYSIDKVSFAQSFEALPSMRAYAPIARFLDGRFSADVHASGQLGQDGSPKLRTIDARGMVMTLQSKLGADFKPLSVLSDAVPAIPKPLDLSSLKAKFTVEDGAMKVKPFEVQSRGMAFEIAGSHGLDQEMDYRIATEVPAQKVTGALAQKVRGLGIDLSKVEDVGLSANLTGSITKPRVSVDVDTGALRNAAAATVAEELEKRRQQALAAVALQNAKIMAEAKKRADQIRSEGKKAGELARKEGYKRADQLVAEAGNNTLAQIGAKEAAKKLRKETDKRADQLRQEADKRADQVVAEAKKRTEQLEAEAVTQSARGADGVTSKIAE